jgi:ABC-type branched-subunit amino acid transport system substrate-binding protein
MSVALALAPLAGPAAPQDAPDTGILIGVILPEVPADAAPWQREVAEQVEHGAIQGFEEHLFNAQLLGIDFDVVFETASGADSAIAAAEQMLERGILGIAGGYSVDEAVALGEWAEAQGIPFINIGVQSDLLRNESCFATTFHVEASAGMYIDALAGWYVRDGRRRWYVVQSEGDDGDQLHERLRWTLDARHFGVSEVGSSVLTDDVSDGDILAEFDRANADCWCCFSIQPSNCSCSASSMARASTAPSPLTLILGRRRASFLPSC